jgi:hypothetical protein
MNEKWYLSSYGSVEALEGPLSGFVRDIFAKVQKSIGKLSIGKQEKGEHNHGEVDIYCASELY